MRDPKYARSIMANKSVDSVILNLNLIIYALFRQIKIGAMQIGGK
jgi:hypothetical protein